MVGKFSPFFSLPRTHKIKQKKTEEQDGSWTDHSIISAKPHVDASLRPSPFRKEFDSFCKEIANSGSIMA
jgi:hypothetical protein